MDLPRIHDWLQIAAGVFVLLAAVSGLAAYFVGKRIQERLEDKIEWLEIEQKGRRLSAIQMETLSSHLQAIERPKELALVVIGLQGDREAIELANSLKESLEMAGLPVDGVWEDALLGGTGSGILIRQNRKNAVIGAGIAGALDKIGLQARVVELDTLPDSKVEVIVGYRP